MCEKLVFDETLLGWRSHSLLFFQTWCLAVKCFHMDVIQFWYILWKMFVRQFTNKIIFFDCFWFQTEVSFSLMLLWKMDLLDSASISGRVLLRIDSLPNKWLVLPFLYKLCFKLFKVLFRNTYTLLKMIVNQINKKELSCFNQTCLWSNSESQKNTFILSVSVLIDYW